MSKYVHVSCNIQGNKVEVYDPIDDTPIELTIEQAANLRDFLNESLPYYNDKQNLEFAKACSKSSRQNIHSLIG